MMLSRVRLGWWTVGMLLGVAACGGAGGDAGAADGAVDDGVPDGDDDAEAPDDATAADEAADGDGDVPPEGLFLPGDFGPLLASPDGALLLVRSIEPSDEWVVDEYGRRYRPRLSVVDPASGTLRPINERMAVHHSFPKSGGILHGRLSDGDVVSDLLYTGADGVTMTVLPDHSGFFDWFSVIPVSRRLDWTGAERVLFRPSTREVFPAPELTMIASDEAGARVLGVEGTSVVLRELDAGTQEVLWDLSAEPGGANGTISADGTWAFLFAATWTRMFDLDGGAAHLVDGVGTVRAHIQSFALEPGGPSLFFLDDEGLKRVRPPSTTAELVQAGRVAHHERTRDGRWWVLELDQDPANYCYRLLVVDLASGTATAGTTEVCPEVVGYAVLSEPQRHLLWSDGPFNGMVGPLSGFAELRYCDAFRCMVPGTVAPDDRWLLVPIDDAACGSGDACTLMRFDLEDPSAGLVPVFAADPGFNAHWAAFVRFARGTGAFTFGTETFGLNPLFGPCPSELHGSRRGAWDEWSIDLGVTAVEVGAEDALAYVTARPEPAESCPGWPEPAGFAPGLHLVPAPGWTEPR